MGYAVPFIDLPKQYQAMRAEILERVDEVFGSAAFILRKDVAEFEEQMAESLGVRHVIGVNSGTDALYLSARALGFGPGDEIITVSHTFVATVAAIVHCGATPVFVDIGDDFNMDTSKLEPAISARTKAILPVHLNGRMCDMEQVREVAQRHKLTVIEDAAQAHGSRHLGQAAGSVSDAGCFSLHPLKILSVAGDGGFLSTQDDELADSFRLLRDHGQRTKEELVCFGFNSRLDNLHAAVASLKLKFLPQWVERRRTLAAQYQELLGDVEELRLPPPPDEESAFYDTYSSYVVRTERREELKQHLQGAGIEVYAHLSTPLHHQPALELGSWHLPMTERAAKEVLSLPIYPELEDADQKLVTDEVRKFFQA